MEPLRALPRTNSRTLLRGLVFALGLLVLNAGCRQINKDREELLLAELRTRTRELEETREELLRHRQLNQLYQRGAVPTVPYYGGASFRAPTDTPTYPLKEITLGSGTGGVDQDNQPGDESLMVMLVPKDDDGTAVKVPGKVAISALEVSPEGLKTLIGRWEVSPDQLRRTWKSGLLSSGYGIPLQWERPPTQSRLRIVVRFTTTDGKEFEADKDVTVRPLPGVGVPSGPPILPPFPSGSPVPPPGVMPPPDSTELPAPHPAAKLRPPVPVR